MFQRLFHYFVTMAFFTSVSLPVFAQLPAINLPEPGAAVTVSAVYQPVLIKGVKVDSKHPLHLEFIVDPNGLSIQDKSLRAQTLRSVRYFLAALTVPNDQLWVNLSPYEKQRIIPDGLSATEMGRDLLAQDYLLKQLTATLLSPTASPGKEFWERVYRQGSHSKQGDPVRINAFHKVWIVPDLAEIREHNGVAVIAKSRLKVMLEEDYLAVKKNARTNVTEGKDRASTEFMRAVILPELEREVNEGANFSIVRQVNDALLLAAWFKQRVRQGVLASVYTDRNKIDGIDLQDKTAKEKIYTRYLKAFKKGVYNQIREDVDPLTHLKMPRKYFSGGYDGTHPLFVVQPASELSMIEAAGGARALLAPVDLMVMADRAQVSHVTAQERLQEIRHDGYAGFPVVVGDQDLPSGMTYALSFYDATAGEKNNPLRALIKAGKLRAGPDFKLLIDGVQDGDGILVSTDSEVEVDRVLVKILSGDQQAAAFDAWKKKARSAAIKPLAIHTSSMIARPTEVLYRYGILKLLMSKDTVSMKEIIDHVRSLVVDGTIIRNNTPNTQYIFAVLRAYASLGWLTFAGESASEEMVFSLTERGQQALTAAKSYAAVADAIPEFDKIVDHLFNRSSVLLLPAGAASLRSMALSSQQGWGLPDNMDEEVRHLVRGQLDGYLITNLALALHMEGVFRLINADLDLDMDAIVRSRKISGNTDELKAALDILANAGFLREYGAGRYHVTSEGVVAFDRVLSYGVPVSYRPSYDLAERFLFGDAKQIPRMDDEGHELLVYRYLNVLGSGASHATYFKQVDKMVVQMIQQRFNSGDIPEPEALTTLAPFVLSFADTGSGDGKFLAHIYHVIVKQTRYGELMRAYPHLYKIDMVGVDYNGKSREATSATLSAERIEHSVIFGDINEPADIVRDVNKELARKNQGSRLLVIHTRTFLDHNRPWTGIKNVEQAKARVSSSTGTYGWRGEAIPNNVVEQNLYEHFKSWADALSSAGQKDLIVIELHTVPPAIAAVNIGRTLDVPYFLSHAFSDQLIIEFPVYDARVKEAGFVRHPDASFHKRFPEGDLTTVSVDYWMLPDVVVPPAKAGGESDMASAADVGGINLDPRLGLLRIDTGKEPVTPGETRPLPISDMDIKGLYPVLIKIIPLRNEQ